MAAMAHFSAVIGMIAFFELLWYLERWSASHTVLGIIAVVAVQRCVFKILIAVFLSREFKHDETNRAWWTVSLLFFVKTKLTARVCGSTEVLVLMPCLNPLESSLSRLSKWVSTLPISSLATVSLFFISSA